MPAVCAVSSLGPSRLVWWRRRCQAAVPASGAGVSSVAATSPSVAHAAPATPPSLAHAAPATSSILRAMNDLDRAVRTVIGRCLAVAPGEDVLVIADDPLQALGEKLRDAARAAGGEAV